ncbi:MAG: ATP-binding protein [Candidatus Sumerlaeia bacterium]|nr:ATP-binding protein [Candidatus Sumerlaeia bacterium]
MMKRRHRRKVSRSQMRERDKNREMARARRARRREPILPPVNGSSQISGEWTIVTNYHELRFRQLNRIEAPFDDLKEFYGEAIDELVEISWLVHKADFLMAQKGLAAVLKDWEIVRECRYFGEVPAILLRQAISTGPDEHEFVLANGRQFWKAPDGNRLAIEVDYDSSPMMSTETEIIFTVPLDRHDWVRDLIGKIHKWMDAHHVLRGRAITAGGDFIKFDEQTGWEDVLLPTELKEAIERNCIGLLKHKELYKLNGIPLRRGLLLHGKPGTGKTMIGRALAQMCEVTFILATPGMIEDASDVRRIFNWGRRFAPSILYFEDFDMVARDRHVNFGNDVLGEFMTGLDGLDSGEGIIAVATTNDLTAIEPALKERPNRFDLVLEVPPMAASERHDYLKRWASKRPDCEIDLESIVERSNGFTGAQMQELCRLAVFEAVEEHLKGGKKESVVLPLTDVHYDAALRKMGQAKRKGLGFQAAG